MIAATTRWPNARRRLPAAQRNATPTRITLELWRRRNQTTGVIAASTETVLVVGRGLSASDTMQVKVTNALSIMFGEKGADMIRKGVGGALV
jgi:hypothetical protein